MSWIERTESHFRSLNLKKLWIDQAYLNISNSRATAYYLYSLAPNCIECPFKRLVDIPANNDTVIAISTARKHQMRLFSINHGEYAFPNVTSRGLVWNDEPAMGEFGVYDLMLLPNGTNELKVALEPVPIYWCKEISYVFGISLWKLLIFFFIQPF